MNCEWEFKSKEFSDLKGYMHYIFGRSSKMFWKFEFLFSCPKQNSSTKWEDSVVSLNFFERLLGFCQQHVWHFSRQMGGKIQTFTTSCRIFKIINDIWDLHDPGPHNLRQSFMTPYPSLLDFWKIKLEKSSSTNWIFSLFRTRFLLPV